jgi:hypothetical protein
MNDPFGFDLAVWHFGESFGDKNALAAVNFLLDANIGWT